MTDHGFRSLAALTLTVGLGLHFSHMVVGREVFLEHIFTPTVDAIITIPMAAAALTGLVAWRRLDLSTPGTLAAYVLLEGYFLLSVVVHLRGLQTGSTEYLQVFPNWYSYAIVFVMGGFLVFALSLKPRSAPREPLLTQEEIDADLAHGRP